MAQDDVIDEENEGAESEARQGTGHVQEPEEAENLPPLKVDKEALAKRTPAAELEIKEIKKELSVSVLSRSPARKHNKRN